MVSPSSFFTYTQGCAQINIHFFARVYSFYIHTVCDILQVCILQSIDNLIIWWHAFLFPPHCEDLRHHLGPRRKISFSLIHNTIKHWFCLQLILIIVPLNSHIITIHLIFCFALKGMFYRIPTYFSFKKGLFL